MLKRFTVKGRMYLIIAAVFLLFMIMIFFAVDGSNKIMDFGVSGTTRIMLEDQKAKLKVATHSVALIIGHGIETITDENEKIDFIRKVVEDVRLEDDDSGYYFVYQNTTNIALPTKKELQGKDLRDLKDKNGIFLIQDLLKNAENGGGFTQYIWPKPGSGDVPKLSYAEMIPGTRFWIGTGVYLDNIDAYKAQISNEIKDLSRQQIVQMYIVAGFIFLAIIVMCLLIVMGITRDLDKLIHGFKDIAEGEGDLTMRIKTSSKDELGELAHWFNLFLDKLQSIIRNIAENAGSINESSTELKIIAEGMAGNAGETFQMANKVSTASEEMSSNLNAVAAAMEQSSTNTNMVAAAVEEMTSTINEIAKNAEQARSVAVKAVEKSRSASMRMSELGKTAQAIDKVTETITDISEQTNLLALNATIEAARAGEAGRGFAVVANEIKDLALKTAKATLDIRTQIEEVQTSTSLSLKEIDEIPNVINGVSDIVATIAAAVEEQSTATREISTNINQASQGIQEVNENINQSSSVAEEITKDIAQVNIAAEKLSNGSDQVRLSAENLNRMSAELTGIVQKFRV